jgi:hypothetical protein
MRDETVFEEPHLFKPERYLECADDETAKRRDPKNYTFGFGRRVRHLYLSVRISRQHVIRSVLEGTWCNHQLGFWWRRSLRR